MRIKIWASFNRLTPTTGPYKMQDIIERESLYSLGDFTHYGPVIEIPPPIPPFNSDVDQSVIVELDLTNVGGWCEESGAAPPFAAFEGWEAF